MKNAIALTAATITIIVLTLGLCTDTPSSTPKTVVNYCQSDSCGKPAKVGSLWCTDHMEENRCKQKGCRKRQLRLGYCLDHAPNKVVRQTSPLDSHE